MQITPHIPDSWTRSAHGFPDGRPKYKLHLLSPAAGPSARLSPESRRKCKLHLADSWTPSTPNRSPDGRPKYKLHLLSPVAGPSSRVCPHRVASYPRPLKPRRASRRPPQIQITHRIPGSGALPSLQRSAPNANYTFYPRQLDPQCAYVSRGPPRIKSHLLSSTAGPSRRLGLQRALPNVPDSWNPEWWGSLAEES